MQTFDVNEDQCLHIKHDKQSRSRQFTQSLSRVFVDAWAWEILSFIFSVTIALVLIAILVYYDGRAQSEHPSRLTLNTLVAIGMAISKGLMISCVSECASQFKFFTGNQPNARLIDVEAYNAAGYGVIGAFRLFFKPKALRMSLLSAAVIIAALAIDPMVQQLLRYPTKVIITSSKAPLNIAVRLAVISDGLHDVPFRHNLVGAAIWDQVQQNKLAQHIPHVCPTESCEWPQYLTLGVCSQCEDLIRDLITEQNIPSEFDFDKGVLGTFKASLPSGHSVTVDGPRMLIDMVNFSAANIELMEDGRLTTPILLNFSYISLMQQHLKIPGIWSPKYGYSELKAHPLGRGGRKFFEGESPYYNNAKFDGYWEAWQCSLKLCVQRRRASVQNGYFKDEIQSSETPAMRCDYTTKKGYRWCVLEPNEHLQFEWEDTLDNKWKNGTKLYGIGSDFHLKQSSNHSAWSWKGLKTMDSNSRAPQNSFVVNLEDVSFFQKHLKELFTMQSIHWYDKEDELRMSEKGIAAKEYLGTGTFGPKHMVESLAKELTRIFHAENIMQQQTCGIAYQSTVFLEVNWAWLYLPALLLLCTLAVLIYTIKETKRCNLKPWKSSLLPLLVDGLDFTNTTDYNVDNSESAKRAKLTPLGLHRFWRNISSKKRDGTIKL